MYLRLCLFLRGWGEQGIHLKCSPSQLQTAALEPVGTGWPAFWEPNVWVTRLKRFHLCPLPSAEELCAALHTFSHLIFGTTLLLAVQRLGILPAALGPQAFSFTGLGGRSVDSGHRFCAWTPALALDSVGPWADSLTSLCSISSSDGDIVLSRAVVRIE